MDDWLARARDALAERAAISRDDLRIDAETRSALLGLGRFAARASGERTNALLLAYLVGRATASGTAVEELAGALRERFRDE